MKFTDLLDEYLDRKKFVKELKEGLTGYDSEYFFAKEIEAADKAENELNEYMERSSKGDSMTKETGGPAFPNGFDVTQGQFAPHGGMDLRDYFAAKVMQGLLSNERADDKYIARHAVFDAYAIADKMLEARK